MAGVAHARQMASVMLSGSIETVPCTFATFGRMRMGDLLYFLQSRGRSECRRPFFFPPRNLTELVALSARFSVPRRGMFFRAPSVGSRASPPRMTALRSFALYTLPQSIHQTNDII